MLTSDPVLKRFGLHSKSQKMKYDRFVDYYMISCNAQDSYRKVYTKASKSTVMKEAYKLVRHPYVVMQLREKNKAMDEKMSEKQLMTRERVLQELEEILEKTKDKKEHVTSLKALDQLAKVIGAYAPIKEEITHKGVTINYIKPNTEE